jgi:hypothetical protein
MTSLLLALTALHMGPLHTYERLLVLLIAFGPVVVLVGVVFALRRRDIAAEEAAQSATDPAETPAPVEYDGRDTP